MHHTEHIHSASGSTTARRADPFLVGVVAGMALLLAVAVYVGTRIGATTRVPFDEDVSLALISDDFDWGTVDLDGGIVTTRFDITNTSAVVLNLYDVKTSCMCTTAQLQTSKAMSRKYGMHDKSRDVFEVPPSETVELIVELDPASHGPSGIGAIARTVTMRTNDPSHPNLLFYMTADVVQR